MLPALKIKTTINPPTYLQKQALGRPLRLTEGISEAEEEEEADAAIVDCKNKKINFFFHR